VLLAVFNDGAMIALSKDRVVASRMPNSWHLGAIFGQGARSARCGASPAAHADACSSVFSLADLVEQCIVAYACDLALERRPASRSHAHSGLYGKTQRIMAEFHRCGRGCVQRRHRAQLERPACRRVRAAPCTQAARRRA